MHTVTQVTVFHFSLLFISTVKKRWMKYRVRFIGQSSTWAVLNELSRLKGHWTLVGMSAFVPALTTQGKWKEETVSSLAYTRTELFSKPSHWHCLHLPLQLPSRCYYCCRRKTRSASNMRNFCSHRAQGNQMISENHVKQVPDTSMRQSISSMLPAVS